ncbi:hypothetical protein [Streptomyces sp. NPDC048825]
MSAAGGMLTGLLQATAWAADPPAAGATAWAADPTARFAENMTP